MNIDSLGELFVHELRDLYSAENQILEAMPAPLEAASDDELSAALRNHKATVS